jgi:two-component system, OmpR family, sensor kinase
MKPSKKRQQIEDAMDTRKFSPPGESFFQEIQIEFLIHELKGPMSVVETGLRMLLEKKKTYGPLSAKQEKTLRRTLKNAQKTRQMLGDLLEIGRSEAGCFLCSRFKPAEAVYDVLFEALELAPGTHSGILLETDRIPENLPRFGIHMTMAPQLADLKLEQDEKKFRQIFGNLVKNALHHRKKRIDIDINQIENRLCIDVRDDGPGIKPEHHALVFRRYAQVNECTLPVNREGHGLGLAGAFILARCLGGNIELESESGKGATFRLVLPMRLEIET